MTLRILTAAFALLLAPALALASPTCASQTEETMTCAEGSVMDAETGTCVPITTS